MIAFIKGKVMAKTEKEIIIITGGIGYEILVPLNSLENLTVDSEVELFTYFHIREDICQLYGFLTLQEKELFLYLINVNGVGPKAALTMLSYSSRIELVSAIGNENIDYLTKVPGIGKKTAQRIILELKEKMRTLITEQQYKISQTDSLQKTANNDVMDAIIALGYQASEVRKIYLQLIQENSEADESEIIKKALKLLAKI